MTRRLFTVLANGLPISLVSAQDPQGALEIATRLVKVGFGLNVVTKLSARTANTLESEYFDCFAPEPGGTIELAAVIINGSAALTAVKTVQEGEERIASQLH